MRGHTRTHARQMNEKNARRKRQGHQGLLQEPCAMCVCVCWVAPVGMSNEDDDDKETI